MAEPGGRRLHGGRRQVKSAAGLRQGANPRAFQLKTSTPLRDHPFALAEWAAAKLCGQALCVHTPIRLVLDTAIKPKQIRGAPTECRARAQSQRAREHTPLAAAVRDRGARRGMLRFVLLQNRAGKTRLSKYYNKFSEDETRKIEAEVHRIVTQREGSNASAMCSFVEWRNYKLVYRRYAGLFFTMCIDPVDNELSYLEIIHL
eukprot:COSAG02_NODE_18563_length_932_cov_0.885954_1_plen_202_part_10